MPKDKVYKKCKKCKETIEISKHDSTFFFDSENYWHTECFIKYQTITKRNKKMTIEECNNFIKKCQSYTGSETELDINRELLYGWLHQYYGITYISQPLIIKLESIFNGTYKSLQKSIPPEHLLEMWNIKKSYLDKTRISNKAKGKEIKGIHAINYDLAILLSKYDSYLAWKKNKEIEKQQIIDCSNESKINYKKIYGSKIDNNKKQDIDIIDMLDEI